ncbi:TolC family protein [bacterium]|nr:TolC family protein [bacterium]
MNRIINQLILLLFLVPGLRAQEKAVSDTLRLDILLREGLENNPQLQSLRDQANAAKTQYDQVTAWDAPQVGIEFFQVPIRSFPIPIRKNMETDYFIQQMFPWPGKLSAMGDVATNNASMFEQTYKAAEKKFILDLKTAYYELYLIQRKLEINDANQILMTSLIDIAMKQLEVGMGKQSDVVRAQTELSKLIEEAIQLKRDNKVVAAMVNTLISQPANTALGPVPDLDIAMPLYTYEDLTGLADNVRPELKAMNFEIEMNRSELAAAKKEFYPDLMVKGQYKNMTNTSSDFWSLMVGVNIPITWWSKGKYQGRVQETRLNISKVQNQYKDMSNMVRFDIQSSLSRIEGDYKRTRVYKNTIIPQAQHSLELLIAEYQVGKTEFLMVLDAYRMLLMAKQDYYMANMEFVSDTAKIEQAVGMSLNEINETLSR